METCCISTSHPPLVHLSTYHLPIHLPVYPPIHPPVHLCRSCCGWCCWAEDATVLSLWGHCEHSIQNGVWWFGYVVCCLTTVTFVSCVAIVVSCVAIVVSCVAIVVGSGHVCQLCYNCCHTPTLPLWCSPAHTHE